MINCLYQKGIPVPKGYVPPCTTQETRQPPGQEPEWIITERLLKYIETLWCMEFPEEFRSRPYSPAPAHLSSKEIILLAENEWHNREERRHLHPMIPWTHGWMSGFLSENKPHWSKDHDEKIRQSVREVVLEEMIAHFKGFKDQVTFQYSAADIVQYFETFKKIESLRAGEK